MSEIPTKAEREQVMKQAQLDAEAASYLEGWKQTEAQHAADEERVRVLEGRVVELLHEKDAVREALETQLGDECAISVQRQKRIEELEKDIADYAYNLDQFHNSADEAERQLAEAQKALERLEWIGFSVFYGEAVCPVCRHPADGGKHTPVCWLDAVLRPKQGGK